MAAAKAYEQEMKFQLRRGRIDPGNMSFKELSHLWLRERVKGNVAKRTEMDYQRIVDDILIPFFGRMRLRDIWIAEVEEFQRQTLQEIARRNRVKNMQRRVPFTGHTIVKHALTIASMIFRYGVAARLTFENPLPYVRRAKEPLDIQIEKRFRDDSWTIEELQKIFQNASDRYRPMFMVGAMTGMAPGEYRALKWGAVDFGENVINVRAAASTGGVVGPKNRYRVRKLPMPTSLRVELQKLKLASEFTGDDDLLFRTKSGRPMSLANIRSRGWIPALKKAELPFKPMNSLRKTYLTRMEEAGYPQVHRLAGHSTRKTTDLHYLQALEEKSAQLVEKIFGDSR
ncbi:MAG: tyrosine-type recombinase/integrase [Planctomycetota bacterium]|jgi:integrase